MAFPSPSALAAWLGARVRYSDWADWPEDFFSDLSKPFGVQARLKALSRPRRDGAVLEIEVDGHNVELRMDLPEESFAELVGDVASLLRSAEGHRGKGAFVFLGTAGAEGDFAYRLELGGGKSRVVEVPQKQRRALYASREYKTLCQHVLERTGMGSPPVSRSAARKEQPSKRPISPGGTDAQALLAVFAKPKEIEACAAAFDVLRKCARAEIERPLLASLKIAAARTPEKGITIVTHSDSLLVELARRLDVKAAAPILGQLAVSKRAIEVRKLAAELLLEWGLALAVLARHRDGEYGIGRHSARARLALDAGAAIQAVAPITAKTMPRAIELLGGLADDARAAKKAKRRSFLEQDRRLLELARGAADSGDAALVFAAKEVLRLAPRR